MTNTPTFAQWRSTQTTDTNLNLTAEDIQTRTLKALASFITQTTPNGNKLGT